MKAILSCLLLFPLLPLLAEPRNAPWVEKGELLASDDFERSALGEWKEIIPTYTVADGVLHAVQTRDDHGAVGRIFRPMQNVVVEFKFQLVGSTGFNAVFDDQKYKGSHAGHICRVTFAPNQVRIGDDKEGVMRNDIFESRNDPGKKAANAEILKERVSGATIDPLEQERWYNVRIEVQGDEMRVSLDDQLITSLKSPGIAHETKSSFHFTVNGSGALFDELRIWKGKTGIQ
ncbi:MAG TPA: hypothetical protein PK648_16315 [Verrucomicrobiales bacterium]|nr:hypothetical protein [Verrucomicrobiales bacterium]